MSQTFTSSSEFRQRNILSKNAPQWSVPPPREVGELRCRFVVVYTGSFTLHLRAWLGVTKTKGDIEIVELHGAARDDWLRLSDHQHPTDCDSDEHFLSRGPETSPQTMTFVQRL